MAYVSREFDVPAADVFAILLDPASLPELADRRRVRPRRQRRPWPSRRSRFHHRVGVGPLTIPDYTEAVAVEHGSMLRLRVRARPFIAGMVTFRLIGDGDRCVVTMEDHRPAVSSAIWSVRSSTR